MIDLEEELDQILLELGEHEYVGLRPNTHSVDISPSVMRTIKRLDRRRERHSFFSSPTYQDMVSNSPIARKEAGERIDLIQKVLEKRKAVKGSSKVIQP